MDEMNELESSITELENEIGRHALFPYTRESYIEDEIRRMEDSDVNLRRLKAMKSWLSFLRSIKLQKDSNSVVWQKMRNWD